MFFFFLEKVISVIRIFQLNITVNKLQNPVFQIALQILSCHLPLLFQRYININQVGSAGIIGIIQV